MSLKDLLGEELATQVESKLGDKKLAVINDGSWIPKDKFNEKLEEIKGLREEVTTRDEQLGVLKKSAEGNEQLLTKISELESGNEKTRVEYEQKIKDTQISTAIKMALNGKVLDFDIVSGLIKKDEIELDENGNVTKGLDEQMATLKESKSFLFVPDVIEKPETEPTPTPKMSLGNPNPGAPVGDAFDAALAKLGL